jgi:hypothetical protein
VSGVPRSQAAGTREGFGGFSVSRETVSYPVLASTCAGRQDVI